MFSNSINKTKARVLSGVRYALYLLRVFSRLTVMTARSLFCQRPPLHNLPQKVIISLTSYPPRFKGLAATMRSLLTQTVKADKIILWIAHEDMAVLPQSVKKLAGERFEIRACDDLKSYKKIIPLLEETQDIYICTADDDVYYHPTWFAELLKHVKPDERVVYCHRAHEIAVDEKGGYKPYTSWVQETKNRERSKKIFPTGVGGVLYPPGIFAAGVLDRKAIFELTPRNDDIWLYWMGRMNGASYQVVESNWRNFSWRHTQDVGLYNYNVGQGGNDIQIRAMGERYGYPAVE